MMKRNHFNYSIFFLVLAFVLGSCSMARNTKEKRIVGAWNVVNVIEADPTVYEQWVFTADGVITRLEISDTASNILDVGEWAITQKIATSYCNIIFESVASEQEGLSVLWEILKLKKTTMILTNHNGGLLTKEFEKN